MKKINILIINVKDFCYFLISNFSLFLLKYFIPYRSLLFRALLVYILFSFTLDNKKSISVLHIIDLTKLPEKNNPVYLSRFASGITYLPLETKKECLIGPSVSLNIYDSIIVCCAHHQIFTFDSETGHFIKPIGEYGHGPDGFMNSKSSYLRNGEIIITALGWDHSIEFSADGKILNRLKMERYPRDFAWLNDNLYAIYYNKNSNIDSLKLLIYDSDKRKTISTFYEYRTFIDTPRRTMFGAFFYYFNNKLFMKEYFNDTVFHVTSEKLVPTFVFNSGKYSPPFFEKDVFDFVQYHSISTIIETNHLIFFRLHFKKRTYICCYDKRTKQVMIPNYRDVQINEFENDIDGFMPFHPISVTGNNELVGYLEPYKIRKWMAENPGKAAKLPSHLQKLRNIKETDNPVVMIAKLKD
jgi:hypothetical protein